MSVGLDRCGEDDGVDDLTPNGQGTEAMDATRVTDGCTHVTVSNPEDIHQTAVRGIKNDPRNREYGYDYGLHVVNGV